MKRFAIAWTAAALIGSFGIGFAQTNADHQQHHPAGSPQQGQPAPAPSPQAAPTQPSQPQAQGQTGMMQMMPEQCRAMMQNMPQDCMAAMQRMMQGGGQGMMGSGMMGQGGMGPGMASGMPAPGTNQTGATKDYMEAMAKMNRNMPMNATGDPDVDFVRMMIPHHQAAIDMAKAVQMHGQDEQTKKWAAEIITSQEREVTEMNEWLKKHGH